MKQLGVKYPEKQVLQISDLMKALGTNQTDTVRAALHLGLMQLRELAARDKESAQELLAVTSFKVMQ